ncbi:hypothetical protein C7H84_06855 [Burkholderia sp. Nafp2/4-1b]|nr:hypothetical protein C7H84_06855 [Burkholderia sp. Nafp2/4-1b]
MPGVRRPAPRASMHGDGKLVFSLRIGVSGVVGRIERGHRARLRLRNAARPLHPPGRAAACGMRAERGNLSRVRQHLQGR